MTRCLSIFALVAVCATAVLPALNAADSTATARGPARHAALRAEAHEAVMSASQSPARAPHVGERAASDAHAASLSFAEPREFWTGVTPSADAFNRAEGDQIAFMATRHYLADSIVAGNFDEDTDANVDVVQTNVVAGSLSVFRGDGRGGFADPALIQIGINPNFVVARDLDRDGHLDLVVTDPATNAVVVLRGDGHAGFTVGQTVPVPAPRNVAVGDFNGDGIADLAVASRQSKAPAGGVTILNGSTDDSGAVTFTPTEFVATMKAGQRVGANVVAVGDFDGSGHDDLAVGVGTSDSAGDRPVGSTEPSGDDLLVFRNRNAASDDPFDTEPSQRFRVGATPNDIAVGDWNNDAHPDLAVLSPQSGDLVSLLGDRAGRFILEDTNITAGALPRSLKVGDFDDDGNADLATATFAAGTVSVLRGEGDGSFAPADEFWAGNAPTAVDVGLFDDDNRLDIVTGRTQTDQMALLINGSPKPRDGVVVTRDISYMAPSLNDEYAAHHALDVYAPPAGTRSLAGSGRAYPVLLFAHGGQSLTGDKSMVSYLMRSLAREGIVAVTTDYRLTSASDADRQAGDYASAFAWLRDNVDRFGGDPDNIVIGGTSAGSQNAARFAKTFEAEQAHIRGLVHVGTAPNVAADAAATGALPPTLAIDGDSGLEIVCAADGLAVVAVAHARDVYAKFVHVPNRDHLTIVSNLARDHDRGRAALLRFLARATRGMNAGRGLGLGTTR